MLDWLSYAFGFTSPGDFNIEEKEEEFNNVIRENIIALLTFIVLYVIAYCIISYFHRKRESDEFYGCEDEAKAYRISMYLCAATLMVSISSVLMLPMSMIGNEIVHLFPGSYWVQWLNGALIHNLWNATYILSNLSIFILLPFSYFFTESEGFSGQRSGLLPRVYETITVLLLLAVLVFGLAVLALAFFDKDNSGLELVKLVGAYYMQYLYSFLVCFSMIVMLSCAPFGFILLFDVVGKLLVKPKILENNDEELTAARYEEDTLKRKLRSNGLKFRAKHDRDVIQTRMEEITKKRKDLERRQNASAWERNLGYPLTMLLIILLTVLALCLVCIHILEMLFIGDHELHPNAVKGYSMRKDYRSYSNWNNNIESESWWSLNEEQANRMAMLGATSLSTFGIIGTIIETVVVCYLMLASFVGFYNLPGLKKFRPRKRDTSMAGIILNCLIVQLLASSLPVLCRVLGITEFVLQGSYSQFSWLGNFYITFFSNCVFAAFTAFTLTKKVTTKMRNELYKALGLDQSHYLINDSSVQSSPVPARISVENTSLPSPVHQPKLIKNLEGCSTSGNIVEKMEEIDKIAAGMSCDRHENTIRNNELANEVKAMER